MGPSSADSQPPAGPTSPPAGSLPRKRVPNACLRCKQQKLKASTPPFLFSLIEPREPYRVHRGQQWILTDSLGREQCDVQRPCTLCLRAGATCSAAVRPTVWKNHGPGQSPKPSRSKHDSAVERPAAKRRRHPTTIEDVVVVSSSSPTTPPPGHPSTTTGVGTRDGRAISGDRSPSPHRETGSSPWVSSSAAVQFMEEVSNERKPCSSCSMAFD